LETKLLYLKVTILRLNLLGNKLIHFDHTAGPKKNGCYSSTQVSSRPLNHVLVAQCACILSIWKLYLLLAVWKTDMNTHCDWKTDTSFRLGLSDGE